VVPGPFMGELVDRLRGLGDRARFVMGNGDREVVEAFDAGRDFEQVEMGAARFTAWCAARIDRSQRDFLAGFEPVVRLEADDVGPVLFCHGSPRSDIEMITQITPAERLQPILADVAEDVIVCGHTHHQFDRVVGGKRIVNAGSVGLPYQGDAAAFWLALGPGLKLRRTAYDTAPAVEAFSAIPELADSVRASLVEPISAQSIAEFFEHRA
jgi:predicted phosphodiesterase